MAWVAADSYIQLDGGDSLCQAIIYSSMATMILRLQGMGRDLVVLAFGLTCLFGCTRGSFQAANKVGSPKATSPTVAQPGLQGSKLADGKASDPAELDQGVLDRLKAATVLVGNFSGGRLTATGSGFVVGDGKRIVTNKHVATGPDGKPVPLKLVFFSGTSKARVVYAPARSVSIYGSAKMGTDDYHKEDLAYITIGEAVSEPLEVAEDAKVMETMPVWALGFPNGTSIQTDQDMPSVTVHSLRIERLERTKEDVVTMLQLSGSPTYGNSGGPVVNREGKVLGVVQSKTMDAPIIFAVPAVRVNMMLAGKAPSSNKSVAELFKAPLEGGSVVRKKRRSPSEYQGSGAIQSYASVLNKGDVVESDLADFSAKELTVLRNEPFARRGYIFKRADLRSVFSQLDWYTPRTSSVSAVQRLLTSREKRNIDFVKAYQQSHGLDY